MPCARRAPRWNAPCTQSRELGGASTRALKVFGPAPKHLPADLEAISGLMDSIGRAIKPYVIKIPQLSDYAFG